MSPARVCQHSCLLSVLSHGVLSALRRHRCCPACSCLYCTRSCNLLQLSSDPAAQQREQKSRCLPLPEDRDRRETYHLGAPNIRRCGGRHLGRVRRSRQTPQQHQRGIARRLVRRICTACTSLFKRILSSCHCCQTHFLDHTQVPSSTGMHKSHRQQDARAAAPQLSHEIHDCYHWPECTPTWPVVCRLREQRRQQGSRAAALQRHRGVRPVQLRRQQPQRGGPLLQGRRARRILQERSADCCCEPSGLRSMERGRLCRRRLCRHSAVPAAAVTPCVPRSARRYCRMLLQQI